MTSKPATKTDCPWCSYWGRTCFACATPDEQVARSRRGTAALHRRLASEGTADASRHLAAAARLEGEHFPMREWPDATRR